MGLSGRSVWWVTLWPAMSSAFYFISDADTIGVRAVLPPFTYVLAIGLLPGKESG